MPLPWYASNHLAGDVTLAGLRGQDEAEGIRKALAGVRLELEQERTRGAIAAREAADNLEVKPAKSIAVCACIYVRSPQVCLGKCAAAPQTSSSFFCFVL